MTEPTPIEPKIAGAEHGPLIHALFKLLADFGNCIERKIPGSDLHLSRIYIWSAVGRIAGEHGQDVAISVLKDIIGQVEDGALGEEPDIPTQTPPDTYN